MGANGEKGFLHLTWATSEAQLRRPAFRASVRSLRTVLPNARTIVLVPEAMRESLREGRLIFPVSHDVRMRPTPRIISRGGQLDLALLEALHTHGWRSSAVLVAPPGRIFFQADPTPLIAGDLVNRFGLDMPTTVPAPWFYRAADALISAIGVAPDELVPPRPVAPDVVLGSPSGLRAYVSMRLAWRLGREESIRPCIDAYLSVLPRSNHGLKLATRYPDEGVFHDWKRMSFHRVAATPEGIRFLATGKPVTLLHDWTRSPSGPRLLQRFGHRKGFGLHVLPDDALDA